MWKPEKPDFLSNISLPPGQMYGEHVAKNSFPECITLHCELDNRLEGSKNAPEDSRTDYITAGAKSEFSSCEDHTDDYAILLCSREWKINMSSTLVKQ